MIELLAHRGDDARMAMTDVVDGYAAREIDVAPTRCVRDLRVPRLGGEQRGRARDSTRNRGGASSVGTSHRDASRAQAEQRTRARLPCSSTSARLPARA